MSDTEERIRLFVLTELQPRLQALDVPLDEVTGEFDLVTSGVLDSMAFVDFVGAVETEFGFEMDFEDVDPSEFTVLDGFVRCAARNMETT